MKRSCSKSAAGLVSVVIATVMVLPGCARQPAGQAEQVVGPPAYTGVGSSVYAAPGWKAGDQTGWEQNLRLRAQAGQDEYQRARGGN